MNNSQVVAEILKGFEELEDKRAGIDIESEKYTFCFHSMGPLPKFTAFLIGDYSDDNAEFDSMSGIVATIKKGKYSKDEISEMKTELGAWLREES